MAETFFKWPGGYPMSPNGSGTPSPDKIGEVVISVVQKEPLRPVQIVEKVRGELASAGERQIRAVIRDLIERRLLNLTTDLRVAVLPPSPQAPGVQR